MLEIRIEGNSTLLLCAGDGSISLAELREGLQRMNSSLTEAELRQVRQQRTCSNPLVETSGFGDPLSASELY